MYGALEEDLGGARLDNVKDKTFAVLRNHTSGDGAVHKVEHLRSAGMGVGRVHATWAKYTNGHRDT